MPDGGLFAAPLSVTRRSGPEGFPRNWWHHQVSMPRRDGVDAVAGAAQLVGPSDAPDSDVPIAAAVRHWCGEDVDQLEVRSASTRALAAEDTPVLRLSDLELHDPALLETPGCPLAAVDDGTTLLWTPATRHRGTEGSVTGWVPFGQSVVRWLERDAAQPVAHTMNMAGLGAARTRAAAVEQACSDLIAQDAVMTWWVHGHDKRLPPVAVPNDLLDLPDDSPLQTGLRALPSISDIGVVLAVVLDIERGVATLAPAAGVDATSRAVAQAIWQHAVARDLLSPTGDLHASGSVGILPHRPDRSYLETAGPGCRRAVDPLSAVQTGLDPAVLARVVERTRSHGAVQAFPEQASAAFEALLAAGHDVWVVDLTTSEVAEAGWHCVRVIATDLARIPVPAFSIDAGGRVATAARTAGWDTTDPENLPYPGW